jgi:hypothetical protein
MWFLFNFFEIFFDDDLKMFSFCLSIERLVSKVLFLSSRGGRVVGFNLWIFCSMKLNETKLQTCSTDKLQLRPIELKLQNFENFKKDSLRQRKLKIHLRTFDKRSTINSFQPEALRI